MMRLRLLTVGRWLTVIGRCRLWLIVVVSFVRFGLVRRRLVMLCVRRWFVIVIVMAWRVRVVALRLVMMMALVVYVLVVLRLR